MRKRSPLQVLLYCWTTYCKYEPRYYILQDIVTLFSYCLVYKNRQTQIKSEQSLANLLKSVKSITDKFDEYEKERDEKNKIIKELNEKVSALTQRSKVLEESIDQQGQYSRRNCSLIHGVEESSKEDTDKLLLNIINDDLEIDLTEVAIDRTHCIWDPKKKRKKKGSSYNGQICQVL